MSVRAQALPGTLALAALLVPAAGVTAETAEEVVALYVEARGGIARMRGVETLRLTGELELSDVTCPLVVELKRPNRMRTEFTFQGRRAVRAFDGVRAWMVLPVPGLDEPQLMPPEEAQDAREQADVDLSPLVDHEAKGYTVELVRRERLAEREVFRLAVHPPAGPPRTFFVDVRSHLVVRMEEMRALDGADAEFVTEVGDYREVGGLVFPHRIALEPRGAGERQRIVFERIEVNVPLPDGRFEMPLPARP